MPPPKPKTKKNKKNNPKKYFPLGWDLSFLDVISLHFYSYSHPPVPPLVGSLFKLVRVKRSRGISSFICSLSFESPALLIHCTVALCLDPAYARTPNLNLHDLNQLSNYLSGFLSRRHCLDLLVLTGFDFWGLETWCPCISCFLSGFSALSCSVFFLVPRDFLYSRPLGTCT